jgi:hypothetical protein
MKDPSVPEIDAATQIVRAPLKYPVHPLCAMYPDYTPEALVELAGDVGAHTRRPSSTFSRRCGSVPATPTPQFG